MTSNTATERTLNVAANIDYETELMSAAGDCGTEFSVDRAKSPQTGLDVTILRFRDSDIHGLLFDIQQAFLFYLGCDVEGMTEVDESRLDVLSSHRGGLDCEIWP